MSFRTKPALAGVSVGSSPGETCTTWDTRHAVTQRHGWARLMNVWIPQGSPYSPAFVVTVKSSHSAFD